MCYIIVSSNSIVYLMLHRECAIKFNDYFEFPKEFDMEPYTVQGLAKLEGKIFCFPISLTLPVQPFHSGHACLYPKTKWQI